MAIGDLTTVESAITVAGRTGDASATSTVEVHIVRARRGRRARCPSAATAAGKG
ncbi:hypothetical protein Daura_44345 [Dactylosporangium aurantiacum]|uniref:Uncharacterized protein n=1 Tax=Dactylosporangium aurantiacum TaxID=35754 RepID=A0A9Q9IDT0_9ACTN|nr:hypothetical protein [Dactylosporangium aurantiacum]MDG6102186.1 hypothetical protein [Dactylosporangium aurantiacum]UWZ53496.1 hypothetical protein Daura_44345 [Dactylosporangium aurantiacum]